MKVSARARRHADRGGDPLDGMVNLFDLGIVLAVGFLLAALASFDLTDVLTDEEAAARVAAAAQAVTVAEGETIEEIELQPGERVVGEGFEIGRVYQLDDGRTVIVREQGAGSEQPAEPVEPAEPVQPDGEGFELPELSPDGSPGSPAP